MGVIGDQVSSQWKQDSVGSWVVNINPPSAVDSRHCHEPWALVICSSLSGQSSLTAAGIVAMVAELSTYWTSATLQSLIANEGGQSARIGCQLNGAGLRVTVLTADALTVANAVIAVLETAGNVT